MIIAAILEAISLFPKDVRIITVFELRIMATTPEWVPLTRPRIDMQGLDVDFVQVVCGVEQVPDVLLVHVAKRARPQTAPCP